MNIVKTSSANLSILLNLAQAYEAEFSSITKKRPGVDGKFALDTIPDDVHDGYLLLEKDSPIGFAVVGVLSGKHDIAEFYVVPSMRGAGYGFEFACAVFDMYEGEWQVRQIEGADKAVNFWRKVIGKYTKNHFEESIVNDEHWGNVTRQVFDRESK